MNIMYKKMEKMAINNGNFGVKSRIKKRKRFQLLKMHKLFRKIKNKFVKVIHLFASVCYNYTTL